MGSEKKCNFAPCINKNKCIMNKPYIRRALCSALLVFIAVTTHAQLRINLGDDSPIRKLSIAEMAISNLYVDSVDEKKLVEDAIRGMLEKLDPHSSYSTPREVQQLNEPLVGNFEGIGVQFNMLEDTLLVVQTINDGPSEKVGILAGDRIVTVNDTAIAGVNMSKEEIMRRLRGPKGTKVRVGVKRSGISELVYFTIIRDKIPVNTVDASYLIRPGVGYVRLSSFGVTTHDELLECFNKLRSQGMRDLILDLQDNGGGFLQAAADVLNEFLENGDLLVYTEGRSIPRQEFRAQGNGTFRQGRVEGKDLYLSDMVYADRKTDYTTRIEEVIRYASSTRHCRSRMLLEYFGQKDAKDCGLCDVCRKKKKQQKTAPPSLRQQLVNLLGDGEWHSLKELNTLNVNREQLDALIDEMVSEEELELDTGMIRVV